MASVAVSSLVAAVAAIFERVGVPRDAANCAPWPPPPAWFDPPCAIGGAPAGIIALADTLRPEAAAAIAALHARGQALLEQLWTGLGAIPGVTLYGPTPDQPRTPTVAFTVEGHSSEAVARHLAELGVFVSNGDFYASTIIGLLGHAEDGVVRAGCSCYTSADEVQRLISGVQALRQG